MDVTELRKQLQSYDQEHLLAFWEELNEDEKKSLYHELNQLDLSYVTESFERCVNNMNAKAEKLDDRMEPLPSKYNILNIGIRRDLFGIQPYTPPG